MTDDYTLEEKHKQYLKAFKYKQNKNITPPQKEEKQQPPQDQNQDIQKDEKPEEEGN